MRRIREMEQNPRRLAGLMMLVVAILTTVPFPALGQEQPTQGVRVKLTYKDDAGDTQPAVGVTISVTSADGTEIGTGPTGDEGEFFLATDKGPVTVSIDPATLPEGVTLRDPATTSRGIVVDEGRLAIALFPLQLGEGQVVVAQGITARQVLQLTVEGIKLGLFLAMGAIGLSLIFGTTGLVNFAHAEMVTWGMFAAFMAESTATAIGLGGTKTGTILFATLIAMVVGAITGYVLDAVLFARLRRRGTSLIAQMVVTIGLGILARYVILYFYGGSSRFFRSVSGQTAIKIGLIEITPSDLISVGLSIGVLTLVGLALQRTRIGRAMRAVADNRDLAESSGIDVQRVIRLVWVTGGALAALGGVFLGQADQVQWETGSRVLLLIFAGVTLGGLGTAYGALVGCLMIGLGIQVSTLWIPSELKNLGALFLMVFILLIRPQGILGRKQRIG